MKTDLIRKLYVEKNFLISCHPGWELKSPFFDFFKKLFTTTILYGSIFKSF